MNRAPFQRPTYNGYYFPFNATPDTTHLFRSGGYTTTVVHPPMCQCCVGFSSTMQCQYGKPCAQKVCANKPNFVGFSGSSACMN